MTQPLSSWSSSPISSLMQRQVVSIGMDDTMADIQALFNSHKLHWAPVLDGSSAVGVVSATDLLRFPADHKAWQLCTYKPVTVEANATVGEVAQLMARNRIHHVVVMNATGMVGVVSSLDFVALFEPGKAG